MTQIQIDEYKKRYTLDCYVCQRCGNVAKHIAHRISKSKVNYKKYGKDIIDHNINLVSVCGLECNDSFNIGNKPIKSNKLVEFINNNKNQSLTTFEITAIIS